MILNQEKIKTTKDLGETAFPLKFANANFSYRGVIVSGANNYQGNHN
jgi:hypothetical protein